jgi:hypothetical protein
MKPLGLLEGCSRTRCFHGMQQDECQPNRCRRGVCWAGRGLRHKVPKLQRGDRTHISACHVCVCTTVFSTSSSPRCLLVDMILTVTAPPLPKDP